jgi:hypothetical protein
VQSVRAFLSKGRVRRVWSLVPARIVVAASWSVLGAGSAQWLVSFGDAPELHRQPFHLNRLPDDPVEVDDARFLSVPWLYGDCDLWAEVELSTGSELDLVVRQVEPRRRHGDMPLYHGRFAVLRLTTGVAGPAWRTREQALFDDAPGGQVLDPGRPASIAVEARGHRVRANVAGVWHDWLDTADAHGGFAFVGRGGRSLLRYLRIEPRAPEGRVPAWLVAALACLLAGLVAARRGQSVRAAWAGLAVPIGAAAIGLGVLAHLLPDTEPTRGGVLLGALAGLPLALFCASARFAVALPLAAVAFALFAERAAHQEQPRLRPLEDPRLSAHFGYGSGSAPFDALARRLSGAHRVTTMRAAGRRVVFLGGGPVWEFQGEAREAGYLGLMAAVQASRTLAEPLDVAVVPTVYSHALQQSVLYERFYAAAFRPAAIVFAVPPWEGEASEELPPRDALRGPDALPHALGSVLVRTLTMAWRARAPSSDAVDLRRTLDSLAELGRRDGTPIVLVTTRDLAPALRAVVAAAAAAHGLPLVADQPALGEPIDPEPLARVLVDVLR